jgi:Tfp pilus assembly PilM family ATPase/Tfp pilus assembly protein PilN
MALTQSRVISISIMPSLVKVVVAQNSGAVLQVLKQAVDKNGPDAAVLRAIEGLDKKGAGVVCVIPGDVATTKNLEVPSIDPDEIESILSLQATRHTPFSRDEILIGYAKVSSPKPGFSRVLMVVVKREAVKERLAILKRAGLDVAAVVFAPEAVGRLYAKALNVGKSPVPFVVVDIAMQDTNVLVETQGAVASARNIPVGIEHLSCDMDSKTQLINEVKASLEAYEQDTAGVRPPKAYITTNHMALAGLDAELSAAIGIPVEVMPYVGKVKADKPVQDVLARDFADDSALDAIAAAVVGAKCLADLSPQELKEQRALAEKGRETFVAGVLLFLFFLFFGGALFSKVYFKDAFLKQNLIEKYKDQRKEVVNLQNLISRSKMVQQYLASRELPLSSVKELYRIVPAEIYLTNITMEDSGNVSIQGVSDSMSQVFTFVTALENSELFEGVKTKSTASKKERNKDVAVFEIVLKLTSADGGNTKPGSDVQPSVEKAQEGETR